MTRENLQTTVNGFDVSTVRLPYAVRSGCLYETMVFGATYADSKYVRQYHTWEDAKKGHRETVAMVRGWENR